MVNFTVLTDIKNKLVDMVQAGIGFATQQKARQAYIEYAKELAKSGHLSGNQILASKNRLKPMIRREDLGRMCMFFYDPKWANELPYYDRFPLIIPIEFYDDGFLGINLHYLPPLQRAKLLDAILAIMGDRYLDEKKRLYMSYQLLVGYTRTRLYEPCIKRYLYKHARSKYYIVEPENWQIAVLLPTERFEKANKQRVFTESMNKVRK